jgi:hypothetical protein
VTVKNKILLLDVSVRNIMVMRILHVLQDLFENSLDFGNLLSLFIGNHCQNITTSAMFQNKENQTIMHTNVLELEA